MILLNCPYCNVNYGEDICYDQNCKGCVDRYNERKKRGRFECHEHRRKSQVNKINCYVKWNLLAMTGIVIVQLNTYGDLKMAAEM